MKKLKCKNQNGAVSLFVLVAMLFFIVTVIGIYSISSNRAQSQTESIEVIKGQYYTEGIEETMYNERVSNSTIDIPIYTKEQLYLIGTDQKVEVEGVVYTFDKNATYELQNDIVINIDDTIKNINTSQLNSDGFEIYYYYNGDYYNLSDSDDYDLYKSEYYFKMR